MAKVSVIIPARGEQFLTKTIDDIFAKARGEIEVIAVLDGWWPDPPPADRPGLTLIHWGSARGMRAAINGAAAIAKGEWLMKTDAHCMFAEGFDLALQADCDKDWISIPRRYRLDPEAWAWQDVGKPPIDYHYLSCPATNKDGYSMHGAIWPERIRGREAIEIDDTMSFQGSLWFMHRRHFFDFLGGMSEVGYGSFSQEPQEIGNKTWLGGGRIVTNKKTWYAHLHKGRTYGRGYFISKSEVTTGHEYSARYWMGDKWEGARYKLSWLVEKFWPVPTWPEDYLENPGKYILSLAPKQIG